ncbi:MAG TPA: hypothetical protein VGD46_19495 [Rhizobacter sp.]
MIAADSQQFPFTAYVVSPAGIVKQVKFVGTRTSCGTPFLEAESGKWYAHREVHDTPEQAVRRKIDQLDAHEANIRKQLQNIERKRVKVETALAKLQGRAP